MTTLPETDWTAIQRERHEAVVDFLTPSPPPFSAQAPERPGPAVATPSLPAPGDDLAATLAEAEAVAQQAFRETGCWDVSFTFTTGQGRKFTLWWHRKGWRRWLG